MLIEYNGKSEYRETLDFLRICHLILRSSNLWLIEYLHLDYTSIFSLIISRYHRHLSPINNKIARNVIVGKYATISTQRNSMTWSNSFRSIRRRTTLTLIARTRRRTCSASYDSRSKVAGQKWKGDGRGKKRGPAKTQRPPGPSERCQQFNQCI